MSWVIRVPSSTANLGAGFDSIGLALSLYLELHVTQADKWEFTSDSACLQGIPVDETNFIYEIALETAKKYGHDTLPPCKVEMKSEIPLARGLGSSSTATIAAIELANVLLELNLTQKAKLEIAAAIEGHPDNVAPCLMGGCIIGHYDQEVDWIQLPVEGVTFIAIIPEFELKTKDARAALPESLSFRNSVHASSIANVSVAAICKQDWRLLGKMMKKDLFHQPYRKKMIPHYDQIEQAIEDQAYGTFLSGAGPTMIAIVDDKLVDLHLPKWMNQFPDFTWLPLQVENDGLKTLTLLEQKADS